MTASPQNQERGRRAVVLLSGGLDSMVAGALAREQGYRVAALTSDLAIEIADNGLPTTFVPARNLVFLSFAGALAYRRGSAHLVAGMCETDYSGYPDCRDETIKAMEKALLLGLDRSLTVHTPLMWIDKAATFALAEELGGRGFLDLVIEDSHSCYLGDRTHRHDWGYGCGDCPACCLRAQGFATYLTRRNPTATQTA
jgi:7-cyano-7-deazaguanine synthase